MKFETTDGYKKMVKKIVTQNEFVDFDLELSDFNLFVEIDAPVFERACTMGGFYNGAIPRDFGVVWHDFRNVQTKGPERLSDDTRRIVRLYEENKEKYADFLRLVQRFAPYVKGFGFEYEYSEARKERVKPVSAAIDFGYGKTEYFHYYDLSEELIRWIAVCLALVGPEYNETIYCFDQIERGLSEKQIKLLPELLWRQENKQIAVITKSPTLVNAFLGLMESGNDFRPNIFVSLSSSFIYTDEKTGERKITKRYNYQSAVGQSDYSDKELCFDKPRPKDTRFAYARLLDFMSFGGGAIK